MLPGTLSKPSYSVISPPKIASTPTAFATSIELPPPKATIAAAPESLYNCVASFTISTVGFAMTSKNCVHTIPCASIMLLIFLTTPTASKPRSETRSTCSDLTARIFSGSVFRLPTPNSIFWGILKAKFFIVLPQFSLFFFSAHLTVNSTIIEINRNLVYMILEFLSINFQLLHLICNSQRLIFFFT